MEEKSLLIGKTVNFSITREEQAEGVIMDKITMHYKKKKDVEEKPGEFITGYVIQGKDGRLWNSIAHWRVVSIID